MATRGLGLVGRQHSVERGGVADPLTRWRICLTGLEGPASGLQPNGHFCASKFARDVAALKIT